MALLSRRVASSLGVCYVIGAIGAALLALWIGDIVMQGGLRGYPLLSMYAATYLAAYGAGAFMGWQRMIGATRREVGVFLVGAWSACAAAALVGAVSVFGAPIMPILFTPVPVVISAVLVLVASLMLALFSHHGPDLSPAEQVAEGLMERAMGGRRYVAAASLGASALGYYWFRRAPGVESALIGFTANAVGLFLGIRSLPNVMAIIAVVSSAGFLLYFLLPVFFLR